MEIILLKDIKTLGKRFSIKRVANGYARNFLIPRGLAEIATTARRAVLSSQIMATEEADRLMQAEYKKIAEALEGKIFELHAKASEVGHLYAAINTEQIAQLMQEHSYTMITAAHIDLPRPIKSVGPHAVIIRFADALQATITLDIITSDHE